MDRLKILRLIPIAIFLVALTFPLIPATPTYAATETLRPNAAGDETAISYQYPDSTFHWDKVDEETSDGNATYIFMGGDDNLYYRDLYNLPTHSGAGIINNVKIYIRVSEGSYSGDAAGKSRAKTAVKTNSVAYDGSIINVPTGGNYFLYSTTYTVNPQTGIAWTWTEIDALQIGVSLKRHYEAGYGAANPFCTQVYVEVDYTAINAPTVTTSAATNVALTTATLNGNVTATGGENPTVTVYWGDNDGGQTPGSWDNSSVPTSPEQPQGVAAFYKNATSLSPGTLYYFSAAGTNSGGTGWGTTQSFNTLGPPSVTTSAATSIEETTATVNGSITATGGANAYLRGFEWDTNSGTPYAFEWHENGSFGVGSFSYGLTTLTKGELYYYRAYATNTYGTGYGSEVTFLTKPDEPTNLVATAIGSSQIDLTWAKGSGAQTTYIRGKDGSYPTDRSDGYLVYNDTGTSWSDTGLTGGHTYYYRAWSYATEGGLERYSDLYAQDYDTTPITYALRLWYQPVTIISGTTLPDRVGTAQNGTIAWGTNSGLNLGISGLKSIAEYSSTATEGGEPPVVVPSPGEVPGYFEEAGEITEMPWYDLFHRAAVPLGWTTTNLYGVLAIFAGIGIGVGVAIATGSALLAAIAVGCGLAAGAGADVIGWWIVIVYALIGGTLLVVYRSI